VERERHAVEGAVFGFERRGDALLRSNVDAHGRVDHQTDVAYDGKVLEVHFFSRRHFLRTTETIAIVEDATSDDVLDEVERRVNDADFVLPEALVQWRAPATRKGLVPEPLDALRCVAELLPAGCAGSMTLRERACWRGNGAPAARAYQVDVDAAVEGLENASVVRGRLSAELLTEAYARMPQPCRVVVSGPGEYNSAVREMLVDLVDDLDSVTVLSA